MSRCKTKFLVGAPHIVVQELEQFSVSFVRIEEPVPDLATRPAEAISEHHVAAFSFLLGDPGRLLLIALTIGIGPTIKRTHAIEHVTPIGIHDFCVLLGRLQSPAELSRRSAGEDGHDIAPQ
ncbi:hypothetical protein [Sorangium sp. So ce1099]|uniref:hypothetical protein n=1 Tax=Sorangium sp. So ce1099 TaxID=3133331 RepID=UPI003F615A54